MATSTRCSCSWECKDGSPPRREIQGLHLFFLFFFYFYHRTCSLLHLFRSSILLLSYLRLLLYFSLCAFFALWYLTRSFFPFWVYDAHCCPYAYLLIPEWSSFLTVFQRYKNQLTYMLREYERVIGRINAVVRSLLHPHIDDLDRSILPGRVVLTWTSMNIDGYLNRIHSCT